MVFSVQQVKYEFLAYIKEFDETFSNWYVGISEPPKQTLFEQHGVRDDEDPWLYKQLLTHRAARTVYDYFVDHLKTAGVRRRLARGFRLRLSVQDIAAYAAMRSNRC